MYLRHVERPLSSKTYFICWDKSYDNCLDIESQLNGSGVDYLVHNVSSRDVDSPNWYRADDVRYYGHFRNSLRDFLSSDHDVFIFNAGDVVCSDYAGYTSRIEDLFASDPGVGAFAPNMTNDGFSGPACFVQSSAVHAGMFLATHTNGIYTALSRDIAETMNEFMDWAESTGCIDWSRVFSGWGLDMAYCALVVCLGKKIYRDGSVCLYHYEGTSYNKNVATDEMLLVMREFKVFCAKMKGLDPTRLQSIYKMSYDKAHTHRPLSLMDVYTEPVDGMVV